MFSESEGYFNDYKLGEKRGLMAKIILCRCEDVTIDDLQDAFDTGHRDLESLKRYTGFATGYCQGKSCLGHAARFLARLRGGDDVVSDLIRTRPLLRPIAACHFAALAQCHKEDSASAKDGEQE